MAVTDQQKLDFLLKKIGYTKTKTGSVVGTGAISGTPKQPFAEAIPSPLIIANGALWNEADSIPTTPPGADTTQVKVYLAATSGLRMTADATSSGQRAYIAYSTYNDTSSTRLTNWIDTQFGASYIIKVYKGDPNSGGVNLSAAGSGANDGWFFDYSAGVLNFNDTNVPSGVTDTNIYIVGYRYIGQTGAPTSGISTFSFKDLTVERNLDVGVQGGISTFRNNIDANGIIEGIAGENKIPSLYANLAALPSASTYHGMFAHVHSEGRGYFAHAGNWLELVNKDTSGNVGLSGDLDVDGHTNLDNISVAGVSTFTGDATFSGNVSIGGTLTYEDVTNVDSVGLLTARSGIRVTGGVIEALAGENKIPSLYANMAALPSPSTYHGMFAHVHSTNRGYFAHGGAWYELVNADLTGRVGTGTESYFIDRLVSTSTTATSLNVTGVSTFTSTLNANQLNFGDSNGSSTNIALFGDSNDLKIYHNGSHSIVQETGAGGLLLLGSVVEIGVPSGSEKYFRAVQNGAAELYYDSSSHSTAKLATTATGVTIDGTAVAGALDISGDIDVDGHTNLDNVSIAGVTTASGNITISNALPTLFLTDTDHNPDWSVRNSNGIFTIYDDTNSTDRFTINGAGTANVAMHLSVGNSLSVTGNISATGDLDIDGHTNLDNVSIAGVTTAAGHILPSADVTYDLGSSSKQWRNLYADNIVSAPGNGFIGPDLTVRNFKATGISTFTGNARFNSTIAVHDGTTGSNGQYLKSIGTGVTWASFPTLRTRDTIVASAGQTSFTFNYTVNFIDVFVNGIKLTDSEFTATNGTSITLAVGCFVGDIVEFVSYNTVSAGGGGGGGTLNNIVEDTSPQLGGNLDLFSKTINGTGGINITGVVTATTFIGDGSGLTGITASGTGVVIKNNDNTVGTAGTINFGDDLSVTPIVAGIVTVGIDTSQINLNKLNVSGISTFNGNIDVNADLDVDGHTELDNLRVSGVSTLSGQVNVGNNLIVGSAIQVGGAAGGSLQIMSNDFLIDAPSGDEIFLRANGGDRVLAGRVNAQTELFYNNAEKFRTTAQGIEVTGHSELDNVNIAGVVTATTLKGALEATSGSFSSNIDANGDLDVDGHTNLDNLSVAGVSTFTGTLRALGQILGTSAVFSSSVTASGNVTAPLLDISPASGNDGIILLNSAGGQNNDFSRIRQDISDDTLKIENKASGSYESLFEGTGNAGVKLYFSGDEKFETTAKGIQVGTGVTIETNGQATYTGIVTAQKFVGDGSSLTGISGSGGVTVQDEGSALSTTATTLNFVGSGVVASGNGATKTITITTGIADTTDVRTNTLDVVGVSTFNSDVNFGFHGAGNPKIQFDESSNLLWFKCATAGASSSKLWLGNGTSYNNLQLQTTNTAAVVSTSYTKLELQSASNYGILLSSGNGIDFLNNAGSTAYYMRCVENSGSDQTVELHYGQGASSKKFETSDKGVKVGTGVTIETNGQATYTGIVTAQKFVGDGSSLTGISGSGGVAVQDEGSTLSTQAATLNFVGTGVVASGNGTVKTITINTGAAQTALTSGTSKLFINNSSTTTGYGSLEVVLTNNTYSGTGRTAFKIYQPAANSNFVEFFGNSNQIYSLLDLKATYSGNTTQTIRFSTNNANFNGRIAHSTGAGQFNFYNKYNGTDYNPLRISNSIINTQADIYPLTDNAYDLGYQGTGGGAQNFRWRQIHANNLNVVGLTTVTDVHVGYGVSAVGIVTADQGLRVNADSPNPAPASATNYISVGDSQDLKVYHNGGTNYIAAADGDIQIKADTFMLVSDDTSGRAIYLDNSNSLLELGFDGNHAVHVKGTEVKFLKPITASADSTHDIGTNSVRFRNAYVDTYYGDGSNLTGISAGTPSYTDVQVAYELTNSSSSGNGWRINGNGFANSTANPDIYLTRGQKYRFINNSGGSHPFQIQSDASTAYSTGVTNNNASSGNIDFIPQNSAPAKLYYNCTNHGGMLGVIYIIGEPGRGTTSAATGSIAQAAYADITIPTTGKTFALLKIAISAPAWVVLYTDTTSRTSDAAGTGSGRSEGTDPTPGSGVLAEVSTTTSGASTFKMTPGVIGWNDDGTPATQIYARVYNKRATSGSNAITVTLTTVNIEA